MHTAQVPMTMFRFHNALLNCWNCLSFVARIACPYDPLPWLPRSYCAPDTPWMRQASLSPALSMKSVNNKDTVIWKNIPRMYRLELV